MRFYLRALSYFRADWLGVVLWLACVGLSIGVGLLYTWPSAVLVDTVFAHTERTSFMHRLFLSVLPESDVGRILGLALIGMALKGLGDGLALARRMLQTRVNLRGLARVRCELFDHLGRLGLSYHRGRAQGDAIYRVGADTDGLRTILNVLVDAGVAAVTLAAMTCIMLSSHQHLTLLALGVAPALIAANLYFGPRIKGRTTAAKEADARFTTIVQRAMSSVAVVQAFGRRSDESQKFHAAAHGSARAWLSQTWQDATYWLVVATIFSLGGAVIFGYGSYLAYRDQIVAPKPDGMTFGFVMVFMAYLGQLWDPLTKLTGVGAVIKPGVAGAERVFEVLDTPVDITDPDDVEPLPTQMRTLSLDHVWFAYDPARPVLRGVSATIRPGQMVAFVGPSGAGKSTLLSLLPRFYDAQRDPGAAGGAVMLDGRDVRSLRLDDVRRHVACVPQDSPLLPISIADNIAYGRPGASRIEVRIAAQMAGAAEFIEAMPTGYDSVVAEGGANLSGGQRQRIAIARALLTDSPILVLDEPTSALDPEHERSAMELFRSLRGKRTVVLVTHRLASVAACDWIYVMDEGRIVEEGTHLTLLARGGLYAKMLATEEGGTPRPGLAA